MGATFYADVHDLCEAHPDVVILASSILSTKAVLRFLPVQRLRRSTLFVDVLSVKVFPKQLMLAELPKEACHFPFSPSHLWRLPSAASISNCGIKHGPQTEICLQIETGLSKVFDTCKIEIGLQP
jgi:hypothetical protein